MRLRLTTVLGVLAISCAGANAQNAKPNDAQIAHIAYTAGNIDIKAAHLALEKSKNKEVRTFAEDMVRDHTAVNEQALALVKKLNVTPEDNDTSKALLKQAAEKQASLKELNGARSTKRTPKTRSPTTRRWTAPFKAPLFLRPAMPNSRICCRPASRFSRVTSNTPNISLTR